MTLKTIHRAPKFWPSNGFAWCLPKQWVSQILIILQLLVFQILIFHMSQKSLQNADGIIIFCLGYAINYMFAGRSRRNRDCKTPQPYIRLKNIIRVINEEIIKEPKQFFRLHVNQNEKTCFPEPPYFVDRNIAFYVFNCIWNFQPS